MAWPTHATWSRRVENRWTLHVAGELGHCRVYAAAMAGGRRGLRRVQHVTAPSSGAPAGPRRPSPQTSPRVVDSNTARARRINHRRCPSSCSHLSATIAHPGALRYPLQAAPADRTFSAAPATQSKGTACCRHSPGRPCSFQSQSPLQSQSQSQSPFRTPSQWRAVPHSARWPSLRSSRAHIPLQARSPAGFRPNAAMTEVSSTRLYLGNLPRNATKAEVEGHFQTHGTGEITEIKLMNGFGFIEYKDAMDARDVVPAFRMYPSPPLRALLPPLTLSLFLQMAPTSWASASLFSSLAVRAATRTSPPTSACLRAPVAPRTG